MAKKASPAKPTKVDLISIGRAASTNSRCADFWVDKLDPEHKAQVIAFAREFLINGGNRSAVVDAWCKAGIPCSKHKFNLLLRRVESGDIK